MTSTLECEHGHLRRVCPHCELIAAEAELETLRSHVALLVAEVNQSRATISDDGTVDISRADALLDARRKTDAAKIEGVGG